MRHSLLVAVFCGCASVALAQVGELSISGGAARFASGGKLGTVDVAPNSGDITINGDFRMAIRFTLNTYRFMGHEFGYGYTHDKVEIPGSDNVGVPIHQGFYDFLIYAAPEGSRVRPFGCGGVQFSSFFPPGSSASYGNQITKFGINYGGGIKVKLGAIWGMRFDVRQYNTGKPFDFPNQSGRLLMNEFTAGLSFNF
jgi:hypothetical protein